MIFLTSLESVAILFTLILVGFIAGRRGLIKESARNDLTNLLLYITLPATIISSMIRPVDSQIFIELLQIVIISIFSYILMVGISFLIIRNFKLPKNQRAVLFMGATLANISFMGFPVLDSVYGPEMVFFAALTQGIVFEIYAWTFGIKILEGHLPNKKNKFSLKMILSKPGIFASLIGLILLISQLSLPSFIIRILKMTSGATSPLAMILVGLMLANSNIKEALSNKYLYITSAIKLLIIPLSIFFILNFIGVSGTPLVVPVVELGMPTAAYLSMLAAICKNDTSLASEQVFVSSLLSIITIPLLISILALFQ